MVSPPVWRASTTLYPSVAALREGVRAHMAKHREIIKPKFDAVERILSDDLGDSGVVHFFGPFLYRSEFFAESPEQECERALAHLERTIQMESPDAFAALVLEPVIGSAGIIPPPAGYLEGVREICDRYGIVFIADEVMAGFGRTGAWFAHQHANVVPDLITFAKGVNSGYVPLGGVLVSQAIRDTFADRPYPGGLTYQGHPLACASAVASTSTMSAPA